MWSVLQACRIGENEAADTDPVFAPGFFALGNISFGMGKQARRRVNADIVDVRRKRSGQNAGTATDVRDQFASLWLQQLYHRRNGHGPMIRTAFFANP